MRTPWKKYWRLFAVVREAHESRNMARGHEFDHVVGVANLAASFCELSETRELAWMAGLCHNADRMIAFDRGNPRCDVPEADVEALVREWLKAEDMLCVAACIVDAVLNHSKPNNSTDGAIITALKDADRVVNARLDVVIRSGQFHPELPVIDPVLGLDDKRGKYNSRLTVVADLMDCLDWGNLDDPRFGVRTPGAKRMIVSRVKELRRFLEAVAAANGRLDVVIKTAQLNPNLPSLDPFLLSSDRSRETIMSLLAGFLETEEVQRPERSVLDPSDFKNIHEFFGTIIEQRHEEGLVPYPA